MTKSGFNFVIEVNFISSLNIFHKYFSQVRSVMVRDCSDLMVGLDLTAVNPLDLPIRFKNCGTVSFSYIKFDEQFSGGQKLSLGMENVNSVRLEDMDVKDAIQVKKYLKYLHKIFTFTIYMLCMCVTKERKYSTH